MWFAVRSSLAARHVLTDATARRLKVGPKGRQDRLAAFDAHLFVAALLGSQRRRRDKQHFHESKVHEAHSQHLPKAVANKVARRLGAQAGCRQARVARVVVQFRPDQGGADGAPECGVGRGAPPHHRGDGAEKWSDVDLDTRTLLVRRTTTSPKGGKPARCRSVARRRPRYRTSWLRAPNSGAPGRDCGRDGCVNPRPPAARPSERPGRRRRVAC